MNYEQWVDANRSGFAKYNPLPNAVSIQNIMAVEPPSSLTVTGLNDIFKTVK